MNLPWLERIGVRLGLTVAGVLLLLALVTNLVTDLAFDRSARSVQEASAAELEELTRRTLLEITEREAQVIAASLERNAAASRIAAGYLSRRIEEPAGSGEPLTLDRIESGHWLDLDPDRRTLIHVPRNHAVRPTAIRAARTSLVLDEVFPSLFAELEDGVGIYFLNGDGVLRYHPPVDLHLLVDPDFDASMQPVFGVGTPEANPERATRWTAPYLDDAGHGVLVTVVTPVYASGEFRGVVDVDVSLARLATRLGELTPLDGSFSFLIDDGGRLISATPGATRRLGYARDLPFGTELSGRGPQPLLAQIRAGGSGLVTIAASGDPFVVAHAPLPGIGWTLAIGAPASLLNASALQIAAGIAGEATLARRGIAVVTLVAFLLALGLLAVTTRRWVVQPIASLTAGARRLGSGEVGADLPLTPRGEFRVLGEAFNRMSGALAHQRDEILEHQRDLERQVSDRTRELSNLLAISADMHASSDATSLIAATLVRLRDAVPFASGCVWSLEEDGLRPIASVPPAHVRPGGGGLRPVSILDDFMDRLSRRQAVLVPTLPSGHPVFGLFDSPGSSLLLVPFTHRGRLAGVLALADPVVREGHQIDLVAAVAQQLGAGLENVRLLFEARERSALEERQHLARELHDSVSQALFGVVLGLHTARKETGGPGRLLDAIEYASELADAALKEMRALIFELRPEALETEGIAGLLRRQAEMLRARHEIRVDLAVTEPDLPLDAKAVLYRVAQEALHNVIKHARASSVNVALEERSDAVRLVVRDDGRGFTLGSEGVESFGLLSMRERMAMLGGRLDVTSVRGGGTTVTAEIAVAHVAPAVGPAVTPEVGAEVEPRDVPAA